MNVGGSWGTRGLRLTTNCVLMSRTQFACTICILLYYMVYKVLRTYSYTLFCVRCRDIVLSPGYHPCSALGFTKAEPICHSDKKLYTGSLFPKW
jgi:hypothetical protein